MKGRAEDDDADDDGGRRWARNGKGAERREGRKKDGDFPRLLPEVCSD